MQASPKVLDTLSKETLALLSEISFFNEVVKCALGDTVALKPVS